MILRVKVNKQLGGKANGIIERCQEIIAELCSIQELEIFTRRVSDCEELVRLLIGDDEVGISGVIPSHVRHEVFLRGKRYIIIHFLRNSFLLDNLMQF